MKQLPAVNDETKEEIENKLLNSTSNNNDNGYYMSNKYIVNNIPWEFEPHNAIRSIVPPAFMTLLPLRMYTYLMEVQEQQLTGTEILIIPRLFMTLLSVLFLDGCLWALVLVEREKMMMKKKFMSKTTQCVTKNEKEGMSNTNDYNIGGPPVEVIVLASSWPTLVMATRPFTNTLEAMFISALLLIVTLDHHYLRISTTHKDKTDSNNSIKSKTTTVQHERRLLIPLLIGIICSIGLFVRFTFAFFALPIVLLFLYNRWRDSANSANYHWRNLVWNVCSLALSFLMMSLLFVTIDWYYYQYYHLSGRDDDITIQTCNSWSCHRDTFLATASNYVVPWNAFRYNSKSTNLAEHGLHPRITHLLVNMPMMFGPLSLIGYYLSYSNMMKKGFGNMCFFSSPSFNNKAYTRVLCQSTILLGLLVLSCAPHQEPRFLLPCIVPLVFLHGRDVVGTNSKQSSSSKTARFTLIGVCVAFNFILYLFFGWLHQGGMVPSLLNLPSTAEVYDEGSPPETVIYYKTYMPPTFLTRGRVIGNNIEERNTNQGVIVTDDGDISVACENQIIIDLQGREMEVLLEVFHERLPCNEITDKSLLMVTPAAVMATIAEKGWNEYTFMSVHGHGTHVSTEDWPVFHGAVGSFVSQLELVTYEVSCSR